MTLTADKVSVCVCVKDNFKGSGKHWSKTVLTHRPEQTEATSPRWAQWETQEHLDSETHESVFFRFFFCPFQVNCGLDLTDLLLCNANESSYCNRDQLWTTSHDVSVAQSVGSHYNYRDCTKFRECVWDGGSVFLKDLLIYPSSGLYFAFGLHYSRLFTIIYLKKLHQSRMFWWMDEWIDR